VSPRAVVFGLAVVAVLVAGCSSKESGSPSAATTVPETGTSSTSTSSGGGGSNDVPKVSNPLDASRLVTQPCAAIAPADLQAMKVPIEGKPDTSSELGPTCMWFDRDTGSGVDVGFLTSNKNGLSDIYKLNTQGRFKGYFEPTDVNGYPAVFNDLIDYRGDGTCNITVGISDSFAFRAAVQDTSLGTKSCDRAKQAAAAVIKTVKGA
jgi:hypothetical protein